MLDIEEFLLGFDDNLVVMDGFDDCIEGVSVQFGQGYKVCYDVNKIIDKLKSQGMDDEEALEYFEFNQLGAYVGDKSPCFITKYKHGDSFS